MTSLRKLTSILLSTAMGRLVLLYGVVEGKDCRLRCECREWRSCKVPGKHPRGGKGWKDRSTVHPGEIALLHQMYPDANWGVLMGQRAVVADCDLRPESVPPKNGERLLAEQLGLKIEKTIIVESGGGGKHGYYLTPKGEEKLSSGDKLYGIDFKQTGFCVAPGSRHISGRYYTFASSPVSHELAPVPEALLEVLRSQAIKPPTPPQQSPVEARGQQEAPPETTVDSIPEHQRPEVDYPAPGKHLPDYVVLELIRLDPVANDLYQGNRRTIKVKEKQGKTWDRSHDDFALACKIAYYTSHRWDQAVRLFMASGLYGDKEGEDYLIRTLDNAFLRTRKNYRQTNQHHTGGRPKSPGTVAILDLHKAEPELRPAEIARRLNMKSGNVRVVLKRYCR